MSVKEMLQGWIRSAVTWKDATIILSQAEDSSTVVCHHEAGRWVRQGPIV